MSFIPCINFGMIQVIHQHNHSSTLIIEFQFLLYIKQEDLYRSGQPTESNFPFLEKLKLKTILFLAGEDPSQNLYISSPLSFKRV